MFSDNRSKKIVFVAHCIMNQNSISDGTADFPSQFDKIIHLLMDNKIGIIQLPCPELTCLGLNRKDNNGSKRKLLQENSRIRKLLEDRENIEILERKAGDVIVQIEEYNKYGFKNYGIIGVNRSPSCGIETTTIKDEEIEGKGVFMGIIEELIDKKGIELNMIGTKTGEEEESLEKLKKFIED